jgi:hypothetical protein
MLGPLRQLRKLKADHIEVFEPYCLKTFQGIQLMVHNLFVPVECFDYGALFLYA